MDKLIFLFGQLVVGVGGGCLAVAIIGMLGYLAAQAWILFSNTFRNICRAESLIFEYRKYRTEFMAWKGLKELEDGK